ncbi:DUF6221 family protein [Streptomyces chrestomyceticus]|uniref:DUF6221 family protein n=1 Tax=Streptomyces chrestomyceticus TaxID=68185 RepID=UPI0037B9641F
MRDSTGFRGAVAAFGRSEQLCRSARQATGRTRQLRAEAVRIRLEAVRLRAALRHWLLPPDPVAAAARLTALIAFVHARLNDDAAVADLFHEVGCPAADTPGRAETLGCRCRVPHRIRGDAALRRNIVRMSETALCEADHDAPDWPHSEMAALLHLKALALPYELHELWQEDWRP